MSAPFRIVLRLRRPASAPWSRRARVLFLVLFALAVLLGVRSVFGERGLLEWRRMRAEELRLRRDIASLSRDLAAELAAVQALRAGGVAVERVARERLDLALPGEVIYHLPRPRAVADPAEVSPAVSEGSEIAASP